MKRLFVLCFVALLGLLGIAAFASVTGDVKRMQDIKALDLSVKPDINFGTIPLYFITNNGQVNQKAMFYAKASRYTLWLTREGLVFDSTRQDEVKVKETHSPSFPNSPHSTKYLRDISRLMFIGANKKPEMVSMDKAELRVNYFIGKNKSKWHCDIPTSMAVLYKNLYKHIDLKVYGIEEQIEYDWIVKAGGDPGEIKFTYKNVKGTRIDGEGNLLIETGFGELMHKRPVSYQEKGNKKIAVKAEFKKIAENTYGFEVGAYDRSCELIIDPVVLAYSTYLGGGKGDYGYSIAVDSSGNAYVTGWTKSTNFPTLNQYQADQDTGDVFVIKLDPSQSGASSLLYSTYLGGDSWEYAYGIAVDGSGNAYVTGYTWSTDFPTLNQYQGDQLWGDVFVTKLDPSQSGASSLLYSTYLGGDSSEESWGIAVDGSGNAYVIGYTESTDFPTLNQYQSDQAWGDVFVTKLDPSQSGASSLLYSTYLGGEDWEYGRAIAVDSSGNAYVTGYTSSTDFPILNQYQSDQAYGDVFVAKLDPSQSGASSLLYSTYLGGENFEYGEGIAVDSSGNAYVTGWTNSTDFPILNQYQGYQGNGDAFVAKLDPAQSGASGLLYSTCLGGSESYDYGNDIAVDASGNAYVIGTTNSTNFPILNQYQGYQGNRDVFVAKLDPAQSGASSFLHSTFLGGEGDDLGLGIAVDSSGNAYVTGETFSWNFPTLNQYQTDQNNADVFVTRLSFTPTVTTTAISNITSISANSGGNVIVDGGPAVTARGVCWSTSANPTTADSTTTDGTGTGTFTSSVTGLSPGTTYHVRAYATNSIGTSYGSDLMFTTVAVLPTVTTTAVFNITSTSADSGGNVISEGGAAVTARGVCWSTSANPTTADSTTTDGTGTGTFTSSITGLSPGTTYHIRAYATNSFGTAYGNQMSFTTNSESLIVTITQPQDDAQVSGTVIIKATTSSHSARTADASIQAVEKVEFYCDKTILAEDTAEPYETTWDTTTFADGDHIIKAVATNTSNQTAQNQITVQVVNTPTGPPEIMINRTHLNYGSVPQAGTASVSLNSAYLTTASQIILINNIGGGTLNWTVNEDANWLTCTPGSGTNKGALTVTTNPSGLQAGTYNATITIQDPYAVNSPQTVPVTLVVYGPGTTAVPFGYFETPIHGSTVMSSIPVTGWVLDDIDITGVKIYRAHIPGQETGGLVYIGDAVMVDGARPDVEQQYPTYPKDYQAGWGYMMLTNFLPNQGNGTFTLYAIATDKEGNEVTLGSKIITCDNASAVEPFGAIDTPDQGGTASGSAYVNFGWALTPQPNTIPIDGSTINVWVDGVPLGNPVYNQYRKDIATLFPGYNNSNGAVGYFYLDTTAYLNGVHTISWTVQDNAGNRDGIGSRYFTIVNNGSDGIAHTDSAHNHLIRPCYLSASHVLQTPLSAEPVVVRKGYDRNAGAEVLYPGPEGIITVQIREDQRVEINLRNSFFPESGVVSGYMIKGERLQLLPIGSTLDNSRGIFYWQPCAGFFGQYRFVFVEKAAGGQVRKKLLNMEIKSKY